jgi:glycolate oxidase FAD binding subunit
VLSAVQSPVVSPAAVEVHIDADIAEIAVLVEGSVSGVVARSASLRAILANEARDPEVGHEPPPWWGRYPFGPGQVGLKLSVPVSDLPRAIGVLREHLGGAVTVRGSAGAGVVHAGVPATVAVADLAAALRGVRALLPGTGGSCVVVTAPPAIRSGAHPRQRLPEGGLDLWGPVAGLQLMRRLKAQFDPTGRFAAGRFVGGL